MSKQKEQFNVKEEVKNWIEAFIFAFVVIGVFLLLGFHMAQVDGPSMNPTLETKDRVLISGLHYTPKQGDVAVFKSEYAGRDLIKRVIATEGQEVNIDFETGSVYVDGELMVDQFSLEQNRVRGDRTYPITVPKDHIFVMGDNRNNSLDSRSTDIGFIHKDDIKGKAIFVLFPFKHWGSIK